MKSLFYVLLLFGFFSNVFAQGVRIDLPITSDLIKSKEGKSRYDILIKRKHTKQHTIIKIDENVFNSDWISIQVPGGNILQIKRDSVTQVPGSAGAITVWQGTVMGGSRATFAIADGMVSGEFSDLHTNYVIDHLSEQQYLLSVIVPDFPAPLPAALPPPNQPASGNSKNESVTKSMDVSSAPVIDIIVAYTPAYAQQVSIAQLERDVNSKINTLNNAFQNSGASASVRLAWFGPLNFTESTSNQSANLSSLAANATAKSLRNQYGADAFMLLVVNDLSGLTYLGPSKDYAYGIVPLYLFQLSFGFQHEVGHLFGADHDAQHKPQTTIPYAHGYYHDSVPSNTQCFVTYMSGDYYCSGQAYTATRVDLFSNPSISYRPATSAYVAVPIGSSSANNARIITESAPVVAAFRAQVVGTTPGAPGGTTQSPGMAATVTEIIFSILQ